MITEFEKSELQLLDELNKIRIGFSEQFKNPKDLSQEWLHLMLKLEVILMENKCRQSFAGLLKENIHNLSLLFETFLVNS